MQACPIYATIVAERGIYMKIGIICALDAELAPFLPHIKESVASTTAQLTFYEGDIGGVQVAAVKCGVGKTSAAIATQLLISKYGVATIINSGTAGGMDTNLGIFDIVVCTESTHHDAQEGTFGGDTQFKCCDNLLGTAKQVVEKLSNKAHFGKMVTGDKFIEDDGRAEIIAKHSPLTVDMETASIAHACHVNDVPYIAVRVITDTADSAGLGAFYENLVPAAQIAKDVVLEIIKER